MLFYTKLVKQQDILQARQIVAVNYGTVGGKVANDAIKALYKDD